MGAVPDRSSLSQEALLEILTAARGSTIVNWGQTIALDRFPIPTYDKFIGSRKTDLPLRNTYTVQAKGNRGGALQAYSGNDLLINFSNVGTSIDLDYGVGYVHLGDQISVQELDEAGIEVTLDSASSTGRKPSKLSASAKLATKNLAKEKQEDLEWNYRVEVAFGMWSASASDPKMWPGLDSVLSVASNSAGFVGGKPKSNPLLRHQLITGATIDNIELNIQRLIRACNDSNDEFGGKVNYIPAGDDVFDMLSDLYLGTSTRAGKIDRALAANQAKEMATKWGIGIPDDSWWLPNAGMVVREPLFKRLQDREAPVVPWTKRLYALNTNCMEFKGPRHAQQILHPMPHNQMVFRSSMHGKYGWVIKKPNALGVLTIA